MNEYSVEREWIGLMKKDCEKCCQTAAGQGSGTENWTLPSIEQSHLQNIHSSRVYLLESHHVMVDVQDKSV